MSRHRAVDLRRVALGVARDELEELGPAGALDDQRLGIYRAKGQRRPIGCLGPRCSNGTTQVILS
jgi:hypothetical protein